VRRLKKGVRVAFRKASRTAYVENTRHYADISLRLLAKDVVVMPTKVEQALKEEAQKRYPITDKMSDEEKEQQQRKQDALIYGTMRNKFGWKPNRELKS